MKWKIIRNKKGKCFSKIQSANDRIKSILNAANKKVGKHEYKVNHTKAIIIKLPKNHVKGKKTPYGHLQKDILVQRNTNKHNCRLLTNCAGQKTMKEYLKSVGKINLSLRISLK